MKIHTRKVGKSFRKFYIWRFDCVSSVIPGPKANHRQVVAENLNKFSWSGNQVKIDHDKLDTLSTSSIIEKPHSDDELVDEFCLDSATGENLSFMSNSEFSVLSTHSEEIVINDDDFVVCSS